MVMYIYAGRSWIQVKSKIKKEYPTVQYAAAMALPPLSIRGDLGVVSTAGVRYAYPLLKSFAKMGPQGVLGATKLLRPFSEIVDSLGLKDPFIRNWVDLLSFLLAGVKSDGVLSAEMHLLRLLFSDFPSDKLPKMSEPSQLMTENTRYDLYVALPVLNQGKKWVLLYSTWRHGISLSTLYRRSNLCPGLSLLVVGDRKGAVFGGLVEAPLKPSTKKRYQGSNDTFVFTNTPGRPVIYRPTGVNRLNGSSLASETYGNSCLSHTQEFEVKEIEVLSLTYFCKNYIFGPRVWLILFNLGPTKFSCKFDRYLSLQGELCGWTCFYIGVAAVAFGCSYYHLKPNDGHLVWDRLPAWPVRTPRPVAFKLVADTPLLTGQVSFKSFSCGFLIVSFCCGFLIVYLAS
uniref:Oxidation resistance protein 1 n=1 Tax=Lactuca sativa TaxID=4236 RepID=A0A9R1XBX2_LACSA|nr:hypothetical protein LSAT_V11C500283360 [Lactuca sativa]